MSRFSVLAAILRAYYWKILKTDISYQTAGLLALAVVIVCTRPALADPIDAPGSTVLVLSGGAAYPGAVLGFGPAGVQFRPHGAGGQVVQGWPTIRMVRTQAADYLPAGGTLRRVNAPHDADGILPRVIGATPGQLSLVNGRSAEGMILVLVPDEVAFQARGEPFATVYQAQQVSEAAIVGGVKYRFNRQTRRLEKSQPPQPAAPPPPPPPVVAQPRAETPAVHATAPPVQPAPQPQQQTPGPVVSPGPAAGKQVDLGWLIGKAFEILPFGVLVIILRWAIKAFYYALVLGLIFGVLGYALGRPSVGGGAAAVGMLFGVVAASKAIFEEQTAKKAPRPGDSE